MHFAVIVKTKNVTDKIHVACIIIQSNVFVTM